MSEDTNKRERQKREARLAELRLRDDDRPRCLHCQIPIAHSGPLCAACDSD